MEHGTKSGYNKGGCRCSECRAAVAAWKREQRASKKKERIAAPPGVVVDFSKRNAAGRKIGAGEVGSRKVSNIGGSPALTGVIVSVLGAKPGDMVEITYGADEIVIRRSSQNMQRAVRLIEELQAGGYPLEVIRSFLVPVVEHYQPAIGDRVDLRGYRGTVHRGTVRALWDSGNTVTVDYDDGSTHDEPRGECNKVD